MFSFFALVSFSCDGRQSAGIEKIKKPVFFLLRVTEFALDVVVAADVELIRLANIELRNNDEYGGTL
jgi:hypothetical protein